MIDRYVLGLEEIDATQIALVGGKGADLGELSHIDGIHVPPGFCVTTDAFRRLILTESSIIDLIDRLSLLHADEREAIGSLSAQIRRTIEAIAIDDDLYGAISQALDRSDTDTAYAVRSSATAEDLPAASFAGQHDSYLNIVGSAAIFEHVRRCWASLFTERAVTYRLRNGIDHRQVAMAVVVQQMVVPDASGVMFTADPVTSNRTVVAVEACFGLGDTLVSGRANADTFRVRDGEVVDTTITTAPPTLSDAQVVRLKQLGRRIEAHFGRPQDIEWCLADGEFHIVQSRPITTLFPIPVARDGGKQVYLSVGHQQMMTDPMKPLGFSLFQLTALPPMHEAGGRLFVDVAPVMASPSARAGLIAVFEKSDPLVADALRAVVEREFIPTRADSDAGGSPGTASAGDAPAPIDTDASIVAGLIERNQASVADLQRDIATKTGVELLDFIRADIAELKRRLFEPTSHQVIMAAMEATWWLNDRLQKWLGEKGSADTLTQSVPHNVTSEMGLALMGVADVIRPHPEVVAFLQRVEDDGYLDELPRLAGGREARDAIETFLDAYGMRCVGEIDITRPRWHEHPSALVPVIVGHIKNFAPGAGQQRFEHGRLAASSKEQDVLERLRALPDGGAKADEVKQMIDRVRTFSGYREYPKYGMVSRFWIYKRALMDEAARLEQARVLREKDDIFFLTFQELREVIATHVVDQQLIAERRMSFATHHALTPPRVMTSEGEVIVGTYRRDDVPLGALVGLPVSTGYVEGRARVLHDIADADLEPGDILVTAYTDPSWTPLFVAIRGLVTEVGGMMTHGAVIAREYGLPAVVGVENATRLIVDGQQIRVHGTEGYVEIVS